jgi:hypothetical protein
VVKAEGVLGVMYKVRKVLQVWVGRGGVVGGDAPCVSRACLAARPEIVVSL